MLLQEGSSNKADVSFINKFHDTSQLTILTNQYYNYSVSITAADFNNGGLLDLSFVGNLVSNKFHH